MADCKGIRDTKTGVVYSLADEEARGDISRLEKSVGSMRTQADSYSRTETDTLLKGKLDISAGTENAGKAVMVMPDGSIGYAAAGTDPAVSSQVEKNRKDIASVQADVKALDGVSYTKAESDALLEGKLDSKTSAGNAGKFLAAGEDGTLSFMDPGVDKTLPSKVAANTSAIGTLEAALGGKAGLADVYTKTDADTLLSGKADASSVPASLSQLENDTGFVTSAVENLKNYYLKSETYTKEEVNSIADSLVSVSLKTVDALPGTDISANVIYLVPRAEAEDRNVYDEYIYVSDKWEIIGSTRTDLSDYYTKEQADALLGKKQGALAFDTAPTADSENPVTSGGVYTVLAALLDRVSALESNFKNVYSAG